MIAGLTLVLSGHLRRPQSADLRSFWQGFIELQRKLPSAKPVRQIVAHSWNPELAPLVQEVYSPQVARHERQVLFYPEFIRQVEPPELFEQGLDRSRSIWKNVSIQSVLGNARSRARAVQLMDNLSSHEWQVLITRWDLGQTDSKQVNQLVADAALPEGYLYLSYFSEVDEGYADMWILAPWVYARRFGRFDAFVLDSLTAVNQYLRLFTGDGWPRARAKTRFEAWRLHPVGQRIRVWISKFAQGAQNFARGDTFPLRIVRRVTLRLQRFLSPPLLTAENSCMPGFQANPLAFPAYQALNIHALLKYFILSEGLRDRIRFLTSEDFDITAQSGQLINPKPVVVLVYEENDDVIARLWAESPLPLAAIYQIGSGNVRQYIPDEYIGWRASKLQAASGALRDLMICVLDAELRREVGSVPVLVMPTVDRYLGCTDWFYMNALAKYIAWSCTGYVGLASSREGKPYIDFPDLQLVRGGGALSLRLAAGTAEGLRAFLDVADDDLNEISDRADRMQLEFPVVVKVGGLF